MEPLSNRHVVYVGGLPRTGGTLLPYLLDGVPDLLTVPWEIPLASVPGRVASAADVRPDDPSGTVGRLCALDPDGDGLDRRPLQRDLATELPFDEAAYGSRLRALAAAGELHERNHLAVQVWAFHEALGRPLRTSATTRLFVHSGCAMIFPTLEVLRRNEVGWYVYLRREPVAWWRSYVARLMHNPRACAPETVARIVVVKAHCDQLAARYARAFPDRYLVYDYEQLVDRPRETLGQLCAALGVVLPATHEPAPRFLGHPIGAHSSFPALVGDTRLLPTNTPRPENLSPGTLQVLRQVVAETPPLRLAPEAGADELERVADEVHRQWWLVDYLRKTILAGDRRAGRPRREGHRAPAVPLAAPASPVPDDKAQLKRARREERRRLQASTATEPSTAVPSSPAPDGEASPKRAKREQRRRLQASPASEASTAPPILAFVHIPKTAGGTVKGMLANAYSRDALYDAGNIFRNPEKTARKIAREGRGWEGWRGRGGRVAIGHVPYALLRQHLPADTRYITFLREPVDRVLSHYHSHLDPGRGLSEREHRPEVESLEEALASGLPAVNNLATRLLCNEPSPLGELPASALEDAKANLRGFAFVGIQERFEESLVLLQKVLGLGAVVYIDRHVNARRPGVGEIPAERRAAIAEHNRLDAALYAFGLELFAERVASSGSDLAAESAALHEAASASSEAEMAKAREWLEREDPSGDHLRVRTLRAKAHAAGISGVALQQVMTARRRAGQVSGRSVRTNRKSRRSSSETSRPPSDPV